MFLGIYSENEGIPLSFRTLESGEHAAAAAQLGSQLNRSFLLIQESSNKDLTIR